MILRRELRPEGRPPSLRFRPPSIHIPLWLLALGWVGAMAMRAVRWLARHPRSSLVLALVVWLVVSDTVLPALIVMALTFGGLCLWWALDPPAVERQVIDPVQARLRELMVYRRHWQPAMLTAGLSLRESWGGDLPVLRKVGSENGRDVLRVRMLPGQTVDAWQAAAPQLAQTFGARSLRARRVPDRPRDVVLVVALKGSNRHVTERGVDQETGPAPVTRSAFPRQPRRAS